MAYQRNGGGRGYGNRGGYGGGYGGGQRRGGYNGGGRGAGYQNRNGNNRCTRRQAEILQEHGYNPNVSFDQASNIIAQLAANGWQRPDGNGPQGGYQQPQQQQQRPPQNYGGQQRGGYNGGNGGGQRNGNNRCTQRQAEVLADFGYDTSNMSYDEARAILDELAANGWQRNGGGQQQGNYDQSQYQGGYDNGGQFQGTYDDGSGNEAPFDGQYPADTY